MKSIALAFFFGLIYSMAQAYTVVVPSTSAPQGTEQAFIALTINTFNASLFVNPLFPDTNQITLYGPAISNFVLLKDSGTYSFVFGEGMGYERSHDVLGIAGEDSNCDASQYCLNVSTLTVPGNFMTYGSTYTVAIDSVTCQAIVCKIAGDIYLQNFSPPIIP